MHRPLAEGTTGARNADVRDCVSPEWTSMTERNIRDAAYALIATLLLMLAGAVWAWRRRGF